MSAPFRATPKLRCLEPQLGDLGIEEGEDEDMSVGPNVHNTNQNLLKFDEN